MSLAEQQWCPTSVQVTALQARGLRAKGKSGTNDAYALLQVGKEKFQTSVVEKSVTPVWKEEATFDLPPQQVRGGGGCERSTLQVQVLHRALVGPDKLLGQAVINLPQLSEDTTRNKTEWFRLLDKQGKPDKDRGEVLLDIQFMRNNMTASMFDLSAAGKSRSRLGKFKDKVRGKKKESDSSSGVVPALTQVMTDSEEEANGDGEEAPKKDGKSKKLKVKSLFSSKSNLQKTMSQSMSVLPVKNSSLSGSQSSGLNVDPSEGKKKFKFKIHKRSGSSDSKDLSFGNQKRPSVEQSNMCINGSHVYCEEPQPRTSRAGSNFSLASSGHGSMEDVPDNSSPSLDSLRAVRQYSPWMEEEEEEEEEKQEIENQPLREDEAKMEEEERRKEKEEEDILKRQEELKRIIQRKEEKLVEEEKIRDEELQRLADKKRKLEEEEKKRREEEKVEEEMKAQEEEKRRQEEEFKLAEKIRIEEEERMEELRRQKEEEERMEELRRRKEEEERIEELRRQKEEEERIEELRRQKEEEERRQEEEFKLAEKMRLEEERRIEDLRRQKEEEERIEEMRRKEEEDMIRRQKELEEMRRAEQEKIEREEMRRREEILRRQEERQKEYERKKREEEEMREKEEEERARKQKEIEEMKREQEERKRKEEEEMLRRQEELERELEEERLRLEDEAREAEKERLKREEEERIRMEEEIQRKEEEKRQREEEIRLKELEKLRQEEEERMRREEQERIEEMRRWEDAERARKEMEENERLTQLRKLEEQKRRQNEEEKKLRKEEEERKLKEERRAAELISSNPFDEDFSESPFEETPNFSSESQNRSVKEETVKIRCDPALVSEGSCPVSCEETDPIRTQREKRPAPRPPGSDQDGKQRWKSQDVDERAQMNKLNPESDVRTVDVVSARLMKKIPLQNKPPADSKNTQSSTATSDVITAKHAKRPAPSRPQPVAKDSSELKTISPAEKIPQMGATEKEQVLPIHSSNPFEDELSDQEDSSVSAPACWPPALTQTADGDAASQVKLKSSKMARAPAPPAKSDGDDIINKGLADTNDQQRDGTGHLHVNNGPYQDSQHIKTPEKPPSSRRLLPVKPLNPSDQHSNSLFQEDTKSPGIGYELQAKNKVDDTVMTGPYSQLTREELICLVLKQESQLLEKQGKISELEQYIDNLLVRVMEEQPSILMSLSAAPKKVA